MRVRKEQHKTQAIYVLYNTAWKIHLFFLPFDWLVYFVAAPSTIILPQLPVTYF